jgi:hypothetical protein
VSEFRPNLPVAGFCKGFHKTGIGLYKQQQRGKEGPIENKVPYLFYPTPTESKHSLYRVGFVFSPHIPLYVLKGYPYRKPYKRDDYVAVI